MSSLATPFIDSVTFTLLLLNFCTYKAFWNLFPHLKETSICALQKSHNFDPNYPHWKEENE